MTAPLVLRRDYLDHLWQWKDHRQVIKIVTGMRRCGKSTLLQQFIARLEAAGLQEQIIYLNFESKTTDHIQDYHDLNDYLEDHLVPEKMTYVILDEIQRVAGWERTLNSLMVDAAADIYVTGSNAYLLSSELSTYLAGRYVEIKMLPLSFREYLELHPPDAHNSVEKRFNDYLVKGAIPLVDPDEGMLATELLQGIYATILRKDISARLGLVDLRTLDEIVAYLMSNVGNITSSATIASETALSPATVKRYLQSLEDAFLFYKAYRYDVRGRRLLKTTEKYYAADTGMRNALLNGGEGSDMGRVLENAVFLELQRRGYQITAGSYYDREIDFVATKDGRREYYQVALSIMGESTFAREVKSLDSLPDSFPKTILTMDRFFNTPPNGIRAVNVIDWLLGKE